MRRWIVLAVAGCGRIGFDPIGAATTDATTDAIRPLVEHLPCETRVLLDPGGDLPEDGIAWVTEPTAQWLIVSEHIACDNHPIQRYAIGVAQAGLALQDMGAMTTTTHAHTVTLEPVAGGYVMAYIEFVDGTAHTAKVGPGMVVTGTQSLGVLSGGNAPFARAGGGGLALVGVQSGALKVVGVDDTGAPTATVTTLAPPSEGPNAPAMVATDSGLAVTWQSTTTGKCRVALLGSNLAIAAGPIDMAVGQCAAPQIAWLASVRRIVVAAGDTSTGGVSAALWSDTLAPMVAPFQVAPQAISPQLVADASGTWVAWANSATFALGHARLDPDGVLTPHSAVGQIDTALPHYEVLLQVAGDAVAIWLDVAQNRSLAAMRFCPAS